jgi:hypothetical protein
VCWVRTVLILCTAALAACQPLPQPFLPDEKDALTMPVGEASLYVLPVANAPDELQRDLAAKLATALVERELPASAASRSQASADLVTALVENDQGQVVWVWQLTRSGGTPLNGTDFSLGISTEALAQAPAATRLALARAMAQRVVQQLEAIETAQRAEAALDPNLPRIALLPFDGAPGDGNMALAKALREHLTGIGLARVVNDAAAADYLVDCSIVVGDAGPRAEQVALSWSLYAADGQRLGSVTQANRVPRGSLNNAWGETARAAAQGGAEGLRDMLSRLPAIKR